MSVRRWIVVCSYACAFLALALALSLRAGGVAGATDNVTEPQQPVASEQRPETDMSRPTPAPPAEPQRLDAESLGELAAQPVAPPTWVQIQDELIVEPTPTPAPAVPLPMLTNISASGLDGSVVYLTFDDGPDPTYTNQVLDVLARYGASATFFVLGNSVDAHPATAQRIVNEGHTLGNHTYWHEALPQLTPDQVLTTLQATNDAIARATGRTTACLRPPYGSLDQATYDLVRNHGYVAMMWDVDSNDWRSSDGYSIAASVLRDTDLGDRVLFHDGPANRAATVAALDSVLSVLSNRGVQFLALPC